MSFEIETIFSRNFTKHFVMTYKKNDVWLLEIHLSEVIFDGTLSFQSIIKKILTVRIDPLARDKVVAGGIIWPLFNEVFLAGLHGYCLGSVWVRWTGAHLWDGPEILPFYGQIIHVSHGKTVGM